MKQFSITSSGRRFFVIIYASCAVAFGARGQSDVLMRFSNRVDTIHALTGQVHQNVRLVDLTPKGLLWVATNGLGGGRLAVTNIAPEDLDRLGISIDQVQQVAQLRRAEQVAKSQAAAWDAAAVAVAKQRADKIAAVEGIIGADKVFAKVRINESWADAFVGLNFIGLDIDEKTLCSKGLFWYCQQKQPKCKTIVFYSNNTGKKIGSYGVNMGLNLD